MSLNRLFVGSIPYNCTKQVLADYFARFGVINNAYVVMDKMTGRSRGFGFVEFESSDTAQDLVGKEMEFGGRNIFIRQAHRAENQPQQAAQPSQAPEPPLE
eukprot:TRINITY_DN10839_c0_g1_i1.p1 TRINITY_DN10839_c0_g1~~TRINITY_DN10839_c0_g1_i1.p1  ORF type:complete len:115 (-),score=25.47 TRINITY_DN10839_c0_g1_i1:274-576(-)